MTAKMRKKLLSGKQDKNSQKKTVESAGGKKGTRDEAEVKAEREKRAVEQHLKVEQKLRDANRALERALEEAEKRVKEAEAKVAETAEKVGDTGATIQSLVKPSQEEENSADEVNATETE